MKLSHNHIAKIERLTTALTNGLQWKASHEGNIMTKAGCAGRKTRPMKRQILRSLEPVNNSNVVKDSHGKEYRYLRSGQLVRV